MDPRVGRLLKRGRSDADDGHWRRPSPLSRAAMHSSKAPRIVSYSQPNGAEISMRSVAMVSTFAAQSVFAHSFVSNNFTHQAVDQTLRAELEGKVIRGIPIEKFALEAFPKISQVVAQIPPHNQLEYVSAVKTYLRSATEGNDRRMMYQHFISLVDQVVTARYSGVRLVLLEGRSVKGSVDRRVPACFVRYGRASAKDISWEDVLAPFYFTAPRSQSQPPVNNQAAVQPTSRRAKLKANTGARNSLSTAPKLEPHEILAGYALEILSTSGLRQHTFAVFVDNEAVSIWYFDRSGAISSADMNLATDAGRDSFYHVLGVFACAGRNDWGFVERLCSHTDWPSVENAGRLVLWDREEQQQNWILANLTRLNNGSRGLIGRGTVVYSFGQDDDPSARYSLKLSWQPVTRTSEVEFLMRAEAAGIEGIPKVLSADNLAVLSDGIRGRLSSLAPGAAQTDRELRALVFDRVCRPLQEFPIKERPLDFLKLIKKLIIIHRELCRNARILHRDISPNNLMWAPVEGEGQDRAKLLGGNEQPITSNEEAYLIDLDFSTVLGVDGADPLNEAEVTHTHALPFLALDHLPGDQMVTHESQTAPPVGPHLYRHDLESFFWSVWWIIFATIPTPGRDLDVENILLDWSSPNLRLNGNSKRGFLREGYLQWVKYVSIQLWPQHEHRTLMVAFLNDMSSLFNEGYKALEQSGDRLAEGDRITTENLLRLFP